MSEIQYPAELSDDSRVGDLVPRSVVDAVCEASHDTEFKNLGRHESGVYEMYRLRARGYDFGLSVDRRYLQTADKNEGSLIPFRVVSKKPYTDIPNLRMWESHVV